MKKQDFTYSCSGKCELLHFLIFFTKTFVVNVFVMYITLIPNKVTIKTYRISSIKSPRRLLNSKTVRCGAY